MMHVAYSADFAGQQMISVNNRSRTLHTTITYPCMTQWTLVFTRLVALISTEADNSGLATVMMKKSFQVQT